jgi:hypothetical protein
VSSVSSTASPSQPVPAAAAGWAGIAGILPGDGGRGDGAGVVLEGWSGVALGSEIGSPIESSCG